MAALVSLEQVIAAAIRGVVTFDHRFAGWVALQAAHRLNEIGGGLARPAAIEIDGAGGVRVVSGTPRTDDESSARSVRELLDALLERATNSTPALRLCAARPEKTGLDGVVRELSFALGEVERDERRREVADLATKVANAPRVEEGSGREPAEPALPADPAPISIDHVALSARLELLEQRARAATESSATLARIAAERDAALAASAAARTARAEDAVRVAELVAEKERAKFALEELAARVQREIDARDLRIQEIERRLVDTEKTLIERVATAAAEGARRAGAAVAERDALVAQRDAIIAEREAAIADRESIIVERDTMIAQRDAMIVEREAQIADRATALSERTALLAERETRIAALESEMKRVRLDRAPASEVSASYQKQLDDLRATHQKQVDELRAAHQQRIDETRTEHARVVASIEADRDRRIAAQEERLREADARLTSSTAIHTREVERARREARADADRELLQKIGEATDDAERRIDELRSEQNKALAALMEERDRRIAVHETRAREAESRLAAASTLHNKELERIAEDAFARAQREASQRLEEITAAAERRVTELRAEQTRAVASIQEERDRRIAALEADRDRRIAVLEAQLAETETRHQEALIAAHSGKDLAASELEAVHARALADAARQKSAALAEAETRHRNAIEQLEQKHQKALHDSARALDAARSEAMQSQLQARTEVLRGRDEVLREAEQRHAREVQAALERLGRTMSEEAERARADAKFAHDTELATMRAEHDALRASLDRQVHELEQQLFRALADRDAERMLRIDVETSSAKRLRDSRRRSPLIEPEEPAGVSPPKPEPQPITPEPASVAPIAKQPPPPTKKRAVPIAIFATLGAAIMVTGTWIAGAGPFAAKQESAPATPFIAPAASTSVTPIAAPATCEATLELNNLPKGSEILRRLGRTPLSARAPMHVPVDIVVTHDGYAPTRQQIDPSAPWKSDLVPSLALSASLQVGVADAIPARKSPPPLPPVVEPLKGMLNVTSDPGDSDVWMSVPDVMHDVPCGGAVDLMVVRPLGTMQKLRVEWSLFRGSPPRATHSL